MKQLFFKRKWIILFLSVIFISSLFGIIATSSRSPNKVVRAESPEYKLTFDYEDYHDNTVVRSGRTNEFKFGRNTSTFYFLLYNKKTNGDEVTLADSSKAIFNFNEFTYWFTTYDVTGISVSLDGVYLHNKNTDTITTTDGQHTLFIKVWYKAPLLSNYSAHFEVTIDFTIDTTPPEITFSKTGVSDNDNGTWSLRKEDCFFSDSAVHVSFTDATSSIITHNYYKSPDAKFYQAGTSFESGEIFYDEGNYTITVVDKAGNIATRYLTIDYTAPTLDTKATGFNSQSSYNTHHFFTNQNIDLKWQTIKSGVQGQLTNDYDELLVSYSFTTDDGKTWKEEDVIYEKNLETNSYPTLDKEGSYHIKISDKAGNTNTFIYHIDKTAPELYLDLPENKFCNTTVTGTYTNDNSSIGINKLKCSSFDEISTSYDLSTTATFPKTASNLNNSLTFSFEGNYNVVCSDLAGNYSSYTFTIDKTAPTLNIPVAINNKYGIYIYNEAKKITWDYTIGGVYAQRSNDKDFLSVTYSHVNSNVFAEPDTLYTETAFSQEGNYYFRISDSAGNFTNYKLIIDKTSPTASCRDVATNGFTNKSVTITPTYQSDIYFPDVIITYAISTEGTNFPSETLANNGQVYEGSLVEEGHYTVAVRDLAFNYTYYTFTIDKTAPTLEIQCKGISIDNKTKENIYATWEYYKIEGIGKQLTRKGDEVKAFYIYNNDTILPYERNAQLDLVGFYQFKIVDSAGNEFYSDRWEINRTAPTFKIYSEEGKELNSPYFAYNQSFYIEWAEQNCTATINGEDCILNNNNFITTDGTYNFVLTDQLGNQTIQTLYRITTLPTTNFNKLKSPNNRWFETTNTEGKLFAFHTEESAMKIASAREEALVKETLWDGSIPTPDSEFNTAEYIGTTCFVYKSLNDASQLNAYFNVATLNEAILKYAKSSVTIKYIPSTPATAYDKENIYREIYFTNKSISFNKIENCFLYVDGVEQSYPYTLKTAGEHKIVEEDIAGNSISYSVYIDIELPIIQVFNRQGNVLNENLTINSTAYFTQAVTVSLSDADTQALLSVNNTYYIGNSAYLQETAKYSISVRDVAGNVGKCTIFVSLIAPTIDIKPQNVGDIMNSFKVDFNNNHSINTLNYIQIQKLNNETNSWEILSCDNNDTIISTSKPSYEFSVSGEYHFVLSDVFGRFIEIYHSFTKSAPVGYLQTYEVNPTALPNFAHTNQRVQFLWNTDLDCSAEITILNGDTISYINGSTIKDEGTYIIRLFSNVDNVFSTYQITIDYTAPTGSLQIYPKDQPTADLPNKSTTQHPVALNWAEQNCTATINGEPYFSGALIKEEGKHTFVLTDKAGNNTYYTFTIDTTPPDIYVYSNGKYLKNGEFTNRDAKITWQEANCTCLLNSITISNSHKVSLEGVYTVVLIDNYGNKSSLTFTIDKTAPTAQIYINNKVYTGDTSNVIKTNSAIYLTWSEIDCNASINDTSVYNQNDVVSKNGHYFIVLKDYAGNQTYYNFEIKNTPPKASLFSNNKELYTYEENNNAYIGALTNQNVRFSWTERNCICTCNENTYSNGATIKEEGFYRFTLTDAYGNTVIYEVTIDKTAPVLTVRKGIDSFVENNEIVKNNVTIIWEEQSATATINGEQIKTGKILKEEGEYTVILTDKAGNQSYLTFILDFSASEGTLISNGKIIQSGSITRHKTYFTWSESGCTATINGEPYSKSKAVSEEGKYVIILSDKAGNTTEYTFTIDLTAPTGELLFTQTAKDNITAGDVSFMWAEQNCTATINGEPYVMGTAISLDGEYTLELFDVAGNYSSYTFTIDKTAPVLFAKTVQNVILNNNSTTLSDIYFTWAEQNCTATLNDKVYEKDTKLYKSGTYTLILTDIVGNSTQLTITIDKTAPLVELIYNPLDKFPYLNNGWSANWDSTKNYKATLNGSTYSAGTHITEEGNYTLIVSNSLGSITSYKITIDNTAPTGKFYHLNNELFNTEYSVKNFYFTWEEQSATATINGDVYQKSSTIYKEGNHRILLYDEAGNISIYEIFLTKAKPTLKFFSQATNTEVSSKRYYVTEEIVLLKNNPNDVITLNDEEFDITQPLAVGEYSFVVTNEYGLSNTYTVKILDEPTQTNVNKNNILKNVFAGSTTGTIIFASTLGVLLSLAVCIPLFKGIFKRNPLKKRLK